VKVVFIVGATASGKSSLALQLAKKNSGAIVNCDSVQVYQGLAIGSALPSPAEMQTVPHYLYAYVPEGSKMTAGQYSRDFYQLMATIEASYENVYVVGGTGFYFQAIEKGLFPVKAANEEIRSELEKKLTTVVGEEEIYQELLNKDPQAAQKISRQDHYRLARAVEMMRVEGKTLSQIQEEFSKSQKVMPWPLEKIGVRIAKDDLLKRVIERTEKMLADGLIEEVEGLVRRGLQDWPALQSVGYKETLEFLSGTGAVNTRLLLKEKIVQNTMKLAKKQRTWFQRDPEIKWIETK
jgi:tRNA dimethylallyltransferase